MDFAAFSAHRAHLLASQPALLDAAETRISHGLAALIAASAPQALPPHAHRCHLAEFWLAHFQLPASYKPRALISQGVRHSLRLLFQQAASAGQRALIPADVYPVYQQLAQAAGLRWQSYPMWPQADWSASTLAETDLLLITNPAKPRASTLGAQEVASLESWLAGAPHRRLLIDAVYQFMPPFDSATLRLLAGEQTIVLHSLSKSWLRPQVMGVALLPQQDIALHTALFRANPPTQPALQLAQALLTERSALPAELVAHLHLQRQHLQQALAARGCTRPLSSQVPTYLFPLEKAFDALLEQHQILAIPGSVFGITQPDVCVLSSLGLRST